MSINMKTKSIIFVLFAMLFVCEHTKAQDDLPYRPFKSFRKDTIRYLDYNFTIRADQYVGKSVDDLFRDLELPVVYISKLVMTLYPGNKPDIRISSMNLVIRLVGDGDWDESKDYYIKIGLNNPVNAGEFADALAVDPRNKDKMDKEQYGFFYWTPQLYGLLKDRTLEGIIANDCLFSDRRKLLERNTMENFEKIQKVRETEKANWKKRIQAEKQATKK